MENIAIAKTAELLKNSGFKQPKPNRGQAWYSITDICVIVTGEKEGRILVANKNGDGIVEVDIPQFVEDFKFAPTAPDILAEMKNHWVLEFWSLSGEWICRHIQGATFYCKNPAEAAAMAWLEKYAK